MQQNLKERHITKLANGNLYGLALVLSDDKRNVNGRIIKATRKGLANMSGKLGALLGYPCGEIDPVYKSAEPSINITNVIGTLEGYAVKRVGNDVHVYVEIKPSPFMASLSPTCNYMFTSYCSLISEGVEDSFIMENILTINAVPILGYDFKMDKVEATSLGNIEKITPL